MDCFIYFTVPNTELGPLTTCPSSQLPAQLSSPKMSTVPLHMSLSPADVLGWNTFLTQARGEMHLQSNPASFSLPSLKSQHIL